MIVSCLSTLVERVESYRQEANNKLKPKRRSELGQYMTSDAVANFMASLFSYDTGQAVNLLDAGAGVGSLCATFIQKFLGHKLQIPLSADVYEIDSLMVDYLTQTLRLCTNECVEKSVEFSYRLEQDDFIVAGIQRLLEANNLFGQPMPTYTHCILNPPYKKIRSDSIHRKRLRQVGIETSNLYSAFVAVAIKMLAPGGQLVAIVPRSFCNGVYFKPFRQFLLSEMAITRLHLFDSRTAPFKDNEVLQENIIFHAIKGTQQKEVVLTSSSDATFNDMTHREVPFDNLVKRGDSEQFIHVAPSNFDQMIVDHISLFTHSIHDLELDICTGPVVDFRLKQDLRQEPEQNTFPLIYPGHFNDHYIQWPNINGKKPNAIRESEMSRRWLMPNGWYVLTRRLSSKEERRRIIVALHNPDQIPYAKIGFENHINVFHQQKMSMDPLLAKGLALFLSSTLVDLYFRQFSGHTQVNATDLRMLHYPNAEILIWLGEHIGEVFPTQQEADKLIDIAIDKFIHNNTRNCKPITIQQKIQDGLAILETLGMPKGQKNERSALMLLALLNLTPEGEWKNADCPLLGITPIMNFVNEHYGRSYAPNTRETFRRQTMHQFVDAGFAVPNPDQPDRPINRSKWVYQIEPNVLQLLRSFGQSTWKTNLKDYLKKSQTLVAQYAKERDMHKLPLTIGEKREIYLTSGTHSQLIHDIIEEFGPRFAPGAEVLYIGDTGAKEIHFDQDTFGQLGLSFDKHGKFPDVILYQGDKNWLFLIEAVTSHGPFDAKRHAELSKIFEKSQAGLVYITAFPNRAMMTKYASEISWETEVWIADAPTHMIHFNGDRFFGPYCSNRDNLS